MGILPQAMVNFLALIGWNPGDDLEVMPLPQMVERFSVDGLQKKSAVFDLKKLEWMNGQYLAQMPSAELAPLVARELVANAVAMVELELHVAIGFALLDLLKVRGRTRQISPGKRHHTFATRSTRRRDAALQQWKDPATAQLLLATRDALAALTTWEATATEGALLHPRRIARARRRQAASAAAGRAHRPVREPRNLRRAAGPRQSALDHPPRRRNQPNHHPAVIGNRRSSANVAQRQ